MLTGHNIARSIDIHTELKNALLLQETFFKRLESNASHFHNHTFEEEIQIARVAWRGVKRKREPTNDEIFNVADVQ
jgi:hypothetical protein